MSYYMRTHSIKIVSLIILLFSFTDSVGQICSDYTSWVQATYNNGEVINLNGRLYTPCYSSTAAPLPDAWTRDEGGCGTTNWGFVSTCSTCTDPTITGSTSGSRCGTGTVAIQATASGGSIEWFTASSGGSSIGSSSSGVNWTTPSISSTTIYYAEGLDAGCTSASRTAVTATVTANPTVTGSSTGSRCGTGTVNIQATASAGSIDWYTASSGGSSVGSSTSGVNWTTSSISSTTTYYAEAINGSCTSASRTSVTATVNTQPTISASVTGSRCGTGTVSIQATASSGSIEWFTASSGGSSIGSSSSGVNWTTPSISSTTTYYAEADNGTCTSVSRTSVTATVNTIPTILSVIPNSRIGTGTLDLQATASSGAIEWFTASSGGSSIGSSSSGVNWTTPSISINTTYYSEADNGSCNSVARTAVDATLTVLPVELTSFSASKEKDYIILSWETMMELNNDYFLIEKSSDGTNWNTLVQITGAGNSDLHNIYSQLDYDGCTSLCYYRLTQVDFDGTSEIYKAIIVNSQTEREVLSIDINPNPIQSVANIHFNVPDDSMYNLRIVSNNGQLIYAAKVLGMTGRNDFLYSSNDLPKGIYSFILSDMNGASVQKKIVKN